MSAQHIEPLFSPSLITIFFFFFESQAAHDGVSSFPTTPFLTLPLWHLPFFPLLLSSFERETMQQQIELLCQQLTEAAQQRNAIDGVTHGKAEGNLRVRLFLPFTLLFTVYKVRALRLVHSEEFTVNYVHRLYRRATLKRHEVAVYVVLETAHTNAMCCDDLSPSQRTLATVNGTLHSHHTTKEPRKNRKRKQRPLSPFSQGEKSNCNSGYRSTPPESHLSHSTCLRNVPLPPPLPLRSFSSSKKKTLQKRKFLSNSRTAV